MLGPRLHYPNTCIGETTARLAFRHGRWFLLSALTGTRFRPLCLKQVAGQEPRDLPRFNLLICLVALGK